MTVASEVTKLNTNLTAAYTAVSNKGGTLPASQNFDNLATAIGTISGGGSGDDNYAAYVDIENMIKGTSYVEADEVEAACDDISMFLYGTLHS